jgi:hypothetical protein
MEPFREGMRGTDGHDGSCSSGKKSHAVGECLMDAILTASVLVASSLQIIQFGR